MLGTLNGVIYHSAISQVNRFVGAHTIGAEVLIFGTSVNCKRATTMIKTDQVLVIDSVRRTSVYPIGHLNLPEHVVIYEVNVNICRRPEYHSKCKATLLSAVTHKKSARRRFLTSRASLEALTHKFTLATLNLFKRLCACQVALGSRETLTCETCFKQIFNSALKFSHLDDS